MGWRATLARHSRYSTRHSHGRPTVLRSTLTLHFNPQRDWKSRAVPSLDTPDSGESAPGAERDRADLPDRVARAAHRDAAEERWVQAILDSPVLQEQMRVTIGAAYDAVVPAAERLQATVAASLPALVDAQRTIAAIVDPIIATLNKSLAPLLDNLADNFAGIYRALLPPNLRSVWEQVSPTQVRDFVREEGIPLYLLPRPSIGVELLTAATHGARRAVLGRRFHALLDDCEKVLDGCTDPTWSDQVFFLRDTVAAARAGHTPSAQALAASVLDTLFTRWAPDKRDRNRLKSRDQAGNPPAEIVDEDLALTYVMLPIWNAYATYWAHRGDPIPRDFARNASAHSVGRRQYNKRNCVQSIMLAASLLGYLQGEQPRAATQVPAPHRSPRP